jgi:quercetin dioxygenase-like cupin family protein
METSSCEAPRPIARPTEASRAGATSRVVRFQEGFRWEGVATQQYKAPADHWCGITRSVLFGGQGDSTAFEVRYFEIAPGGFSSLESHAHEHAVIVLRGRGEVRLGDETHALAFGDSVYVAPHEVHQFRNSSSEPASEPFGFLCIVDAQRDRSVVRPK